MQNDGTQEKCQETLCEMWGGQESLLGKGGVYTEQDRNEGWERSRRREEAIALVELERYRSNISRDNSIRELCCVSCWFKSACFPRSKPYHWGLPMEQGALAEGERHT